MSAIHEDDTLPSPSLLTISDVVQRLNGQIHSTLSESNGEASKAFGGFELHTRLPDGSSRPATETEMLAADFQMKLQQTVQILQALPHKSAQLQWAEEQRTHVGNIYYQNQKYEEAVDVYLTLLAVSVDSDKEEASIQGQQVVLYAKLMNNLALCSLQLRRYQKAIAFCSMALDHIQITMDRWIFSSYNQNEGEMQNFAIPYVNDDDNVVGSVIDDFFVILAQQRSKLFYKRAKAYRLKGEYDFAERDLAILREELKLLHRSEGNARQLEGVLDADHWYTIVRKEEQLLQHSIAQEKLSCKRRQKALQMLMKPTNNSTLDMEMASRAQQSALSASNQLRPLYSGTSHRSVVSNRTYSTLRFMETHPLPRSASKSTTKIRAHKLLMQYFIELWRWFIHFMLSLFVKGRRKSFKL